MKHLISKIICVLLLVSFAFAFTACGSEVENGSKITRVKLTVEFYDEEGVATEYAIFAKLYENFAPETVKHIKAKIESGYYNGTCISHASSSYVQFGDYTLSTNGTLNAKDQGDAILGEFYKTGWTGNPLTAESGALVLMRDDTVKGDAKYNTGKATIAISFSFAAFDKDSYCIFGKLVGDDGDSKSEDEMLQKSSYGKMNTITERISNADGKKLYFCKASEAINNGEEGENKQEIEIAGKYVTYLKYDEEMTYVIGDRFFNDASDVRENLSEATIVAEEFVADLTEKLNDSENQFLSVPVLKVIIKTVEIVK